MKSLRISITTTILILLMVNLVMGQENIEPERQAKIAILPFSAIGIDDISVNTAEFLLEQQLFELSTMKIITRKEVLQTVGDKPCSEIDCGIKIGEKLDADQALLINLSKLGEKIIIQYMLIDVPGQSIILKDYTSTETIEDLEIVMKRIALSVTSQKPFEKSAEVGAITEKETEIPRRRKARRLLGLSLGYLYPKNGYDNSEQSFTIDIRSGYELENLEVGGQFALRKGVALNLYSLYLFSKTDFCPYIGGAFGFHWVAHEDLFFDFDGKRSDGFELIASAGIRAFRTYNFRILINLDYTITFNDYNDSAIVFTIGLISSD